MSRKPLDKYYSPEIFIPPLLTHIEIAEGSTIFEPCVGGGSLVTALKKCGVKGRFITNDINPNINATLHRDASSFEIWEMMRTSKIIGRPDWVITNPPFNKAIPIIELALKFAKVGVAFYLRLSFQEACENRADLLYNQPPNKQITLPRFSFTGDGNLDKVTGAWFVWLQGISEQFMISYNKERLQEMWNQYLIM